MKASLSDSTKITGMEFVFISAKTHPFVVHLKLAIAILLTPVTLLFLGRSIRVRERLG